MASRLRPRTVLLAMLLLLVFPLPEYAFKSPKARRSHSTAGSFRRRLHVNSLITEPGTFEWEWTSLYDPGGDWLLPTTWKVTPGTGDTFWGRTELSANFDAVQRFDNSGDPVIHTSDHIVFGLTTGLPDFLGMQWAVSPNATVLFRSDTGTRLGAAVLGKFEQGRHQGGVQIMWTGATHPSDTNPAGTFDIGFGYGFQLGTGRWSSRWTPYASFLVERSTGQAVYYNFIEGIEYQATTRLAFDFSFQQQSIPSPTDRQNLIAVGITWNLGRIRR